MAAMCRRHFLLTSGAVLSGLAGAGTMSGCATEPTVTVVPGLTHAVSILTDPFGVPHVQAASVADAFFGDGYVAARDHLWQLDFNHRQGMGRLAEVFGADCVESDTASRLFLFRGDVEAELAGLDPVTRDAAAAYVAGVNAFIARTEARPEDLPPIFRILEYRPMRWHLHDMVRLRAEATGNTRAEIRRARLAARDALAMDALIRPLSPEHRLVVPEGLDVHAITEADLGLFATLQSGPPIAQLGTGRPVTRRLNEGSNAWVIAPSRTATGRPILANDPHLSFGAPGPRHVVHLKAPGLDVIGGGFPGMPGVMQGHNARTAWGRTNFHIDQEDLFILRTDPDRPDHYWHGGRWVPMARETVTVPVKGEADRTVTLFYATQGPVVYRDGAAHRATAVAATWLAPGANGLLANIGINQAQDWASFRAALRLHTSPTNFVYADVDGHIGWQAAGGVPDRAAGYDGLMPAPGDGRFDWRGLQTLEDLPSALDPAEGWFGTSNQMNLPTGYDNERHRVSFEWSPPYRYRRVAAVLRAETQATVAQSVALQHDVYSDLARRVAALLPDAPDMAREVTLLRQWDGHVSADSAAAALYELWWSALCGALHRRVVPPHLHDLLPELDVTVIDTLLMAPDHRLGAKPVQARDTMMLAALRTAKAGLVVRLGPDPLGWRWGALHTVTIRHPLHHIPGIAAAYPPIGGPESASGGDAYTVMARWYKPTRHIADPYEATGGASYLMVCDVGAWENAVYLNLPGQTADPGSPYYADCLEDWLAGRMRPMRFGEEALMQAGGAMTVLRGAV